MTGRGHGLSQRKRQNRSSHPRNSTFSSASIRPLQFPILFATTSKAMAERPAKSGSSRKRALVSCDRCKIRRARCIRENADVPCADCKANGVVCESKLPRKQRVYGSVETLSLRYRALESLVKGLFPDENVQDTETLFKIATASNIAMPASDDYTPADIFSNSSSDRQASSSEQQQKQQQHQSLQTSPIAQSPYLDPHTTTYPLHTAHRTSSLYTSTCVPLESRLWCRLSWTPVIHIKPLKSIRIGAETQQHKSFGRRICYTHIEPASQFEPWKSEEIQN
jgi:hypothetical protein